MGLLLWKAKEELVRVDVALRLTTVSTRVTVAAASDPSMVSVC